MIKKPMILGIGLLLCLLGATGCVDSQLEAVTHRITGKVTMVGEAQGSGVSLTQVSTSLEQQQGRGGVVVSDAVKDDGSFDYVAPPGSYVIRAEISGNECGSIAVNSAMSDVQNVILECRVK